jgi:hypothetical protein
MGLTIRPRVGQVLGIYYNNQFLGTIDIVPSNTGRGIAMVANLPRELGIDINYKRVVTPPPTFGDHIPDDELWHVPKEAGNLYDEY